MISFDAESHTYTADDGSILPSVSEILAGAGMYDGLDRIPPAILARAGAFGKAVHLATEYDDDGDLDEASVTAEVMDRVNGWRKFRAERKPLVEATEKIVDGGNYAGTIDRVMFFDHARWIVDIKTSSKISPVWGLQLGGYAQAHEGAEKIAAVWLPKAGGYQFIEYDLKPCVEAFNHCLGVWIWKFKHGMAKR